MKKRLSIVVSVRGFNESVDLFMGLMWAVAVDPSVIYGRLFIESYRAKPRLSCCISLFSIHFARFVFQLTSPKSLHAQNTGDKYDQALVKAVYKRGRQLKAFGHLVFLCNI